MKSSIHRRSRRLLSAIVAMGLGICSATLAGEFESFAGIEKESKGPSKLDLRKYCAQRNQGELGTCHAFALSCPIEKLENAGKSDEELKKKPYRVSTNWLVFLSIVDRLCRGKRAVRTNEGYDPGRNLERLKTIGYCSLDAFKPYNPADYKRGKAADTEKGGRDDSELRSLYDHYFGPEHKGPSARGEKEPPPPPSVILEKFKKAFGISQEDARKAFCDEKNVDRNVKALIESKKVRDDFKKCYDEAKESRKKLKACKPSYSYDKALSASDKLKKIKALLNNKEPVIATFRNYPKWTAAKEGHEYHALAIRGFDDEKRELLVQNSWGKGQNIPIPYSKLSNMMGFGALNCSQATSRDYAHRDPSEREHSREDAKSYPDDRGSSLPSHD